jgi:aspartate-semialdehyde dehydrogenase
MTAPAPRSAPARLPVGVLGATGTVGQRLVAMLAEHPWFELAAVMASERSVGTPYGEAVRWHLPGEPPASAAALPVRPCEPRPDLPLVLSALTTDAAHHYERPWADAGALVVSNAAAHRMDRDVPLLVPEINAEHLALLETQPHGAGGLVTNPNCSTIGLAMALAPLHQAFGVEAVHVVTLQALSGAGLPGVAALEALDNVIPFIPNEEDKLPAETARILGRHTADGVVPTALTLSAQCNRVPVTDGHTVCASVRLGEVVDRDAVLTAWREWRPPADVTRLPSAPPEPLVVLDSPDGPQPRLHRDLHGGMAVSVGRLQPCPLLHHRFVALVHNTVRGAAGGALLVAELLAARGRVPGGWSPPDA